VSDRPDLPVGVRGSQSCGSTPMDARIAMASAVFNFAVEDEANEVGPQTSGKENECERGRQTSGPRFDSSARGSDVASGPVVSACRAQSVWAAWRENGKWAKFGICGPGRFFLPFSFYFLFSFLVFFYS
jgi:hypothetical protein